MSFYQNLNSELKKFIIEDVRTVGHLIGQGSFGSTEEIVVDKGSCAGKFYYKSSLYPDKVIVSPASVMRRCALECQQLSQINHANIVEFFGIYFSQGSPVPTLVMELLPYNLESKINSSDEFLLSVKFHILNEVARGIVFLHSKTPPLVHRDLTSHNVLLNADVSVVKISDCRNMAIVDPTKANEVMHANKKLLCYMPPEVSSVNPHFDPPVDIFSYGHLALYTMIQKFPGPLPLKWYSGESWQTEEKAHTELERRKEYMDILEDMMGISAPVFEVITRSLDDSAQLRPEADQVLEYISAQITIESDKVESMMNGESDFLQVFTKPKLKRGVWKVLEFQIKNWCLVWKKPETREIVNTLPFSSMVSAETKEVKDDKTKYCFSIEIQGQPPLLLCTLSQEKRTNWVTAIKLGIQQAKSPLPVKRRSKEDKAPKKISKQKSLFRIKSKQDKRLSLKSAGSTFELNLPFQRFEEREERDEKRRNPSDILPPLPQQYHKSGDDECTIQMNPSYQAITQVESKRSPKDTLPSLPSANYEQAYNEIAPTGVLNMGSEEHEYEDTIIQQEYGYDDTVIQRGATVKEEERPPPVPPRLQSRYSQQSLINTVQSEEYVPMNQLIRQEPTDSPAEPQVLIPSVPSIVHSNEEGIISDEPLHTTSIDDRDLHLSFGNLSSLETPSPKAPHYNMEAFMHFFTPSKPSSSKEPELTSEHSNKSILTKGDPEKDLSQAVLGSSSTRSKHSYDTLQREHWRPELKSKPLDVPSRSDFTATPSWQPASESPRSGSSPQKESFEMQTVMLQKMQQALEAVQEAYAYMPFMSPESETPRAESGLSIVTSLYDDNEEKECKNSVPQAQMARCLNELLSKTPVVSPDKLGYDQQMITQKLARLARANSDQGDGKLMDPLNTLQKQAFNHIISKKEIYNKKLVDQGQYTTLSTADLRHRGVITKILITSLKQPKSKEEKEKFFHQQKMIAEMMHPNIARHFILHDQEQLSESPMIVSELLPNGDLKTFLQHSDRPIPKLLSYMLDVSMGMHYLAQRGLVHRYLAARNIVVNQNEKCKVSGFTYLIQSSDCSSSDILGSDLPTLSRWLAPESIADTRQFSTASDVWSFGVVQWEMRNPHKDPYHDTASAEVLKLEMSHNASLCIPKDYPDEVKNIMKACWEQDPLQRPSFLLIANILSVIL